VGQGDLVIALHLQHQHDNHHDWHDAKVAPCQGSRPSPTSCNQRITGLIGTKMHPTFTGELQYLSQPRPSTPCHTTRMKEHLLSLNLLEGLQATGHASHRSCDCNLYVPCLPTARQCNQTICWPGFSSMVNGLFHDPPCCRSPLAWLCQCCVCSTCHHCRASAALASVTRCLLHRPCPDRRPHPLCCQWTARG
jgi:hypothetical protein